MQNIPQPSTPSIPEVPTPSPTTVEEPIVVPIPLIQCQDGGVPYIWKSTDTLEGVARSRGITVDTMRALNPTVNFAALRPGDTICLPPPTLICPDGRLYRIQAGDTFPMIASRFGTTVAALTAANPYVDPSNLVQGEYICIPGQVPVPPPHCPTGWVYTVERGDTFASIARRYSTTPRELARLNPTVDPNNLRVGQEICLPTAAAPSPPTPPTPRCLSGWIYYVEPGDSFQSIARKMGTTTAALRAANPTVNPNSLTVGQALCLPQAPAPQPAPCPSGYVYYVERGDSLSGIAAKFGVSVSDMLSVNPNVDPNRLMVGQPLCLPADAVPPVVPPRPQRACPPGYRMVTVQIGEDFNTLLQRYNVSYDALRSPNINLNLDRLLPGQQVCVAPSGSRGVCGDGSIHILKRGDTLESVSRETGVPPGQLMKANPGFLPGDFVGGKAICVPRNP